MELGAFSISLTVKDLKKSKEFYEKLGFTVKNPGGDNWVVLKNGTCVIGLFNGMFDKNMLTFNPGWNSDAQALEKFTDVRQLQGELKQQGVDIMPEADETSTGPAYFMLHDPDGNPILFDQHI